MKYCLWVPLALMMTSTCACEEDDPKENSEEDTGTDTADTDRSPCLDDAISDYTEDLTDCSPLATDYQPRSAGADSWDACISDDNTYHRIEESISSIARVEAYEAIGELLWDNPKVPSGQDFIEGRILLDAEEGLGSRLDRRYDVHYDSPADGSSCDEEAVPALYPDYCVGPATLRPAINAALAAGSEGTNPVINAEIIHAAIQWFLYVSASKEATTCTETAKDCDSSWAYFTGGRVREDPIGLAAEIMKAAPETYNRAYDGALAVRCWRDLDPGETGTNLELRDQAIAQYDDAIVHGVSILIRQRFQAIGSCEDAAEKSAAHEALKLLVPLLDLETRSRDTTAADALTAEVAKETAAVDTAAAIAAIDSVYLCP